MPIAILDLTPRYIQAGEDSPATYHAAYPELFQHYYRFWADIEDDTQFPAEMVREKAALIRSRLPMIQQAFAREGFSDQLLLTLFVGKGTSNGHVFWDEARRAFVVWLPVEAYATPQQVDIFVTHELIHALHYIRQPRFYFTDEASKHLVGRQLITEGLATWGAQAVLGVDEVRALWADYVPSDFAQRWYAQCQLRERELAQQLLAAWRESQPENPWFSMWDETDVTRYRGGYYMGLQMMKRLSQEHGWSLHDMLQLEAEELEASILATLESMEAGA